MTSSATPSGQDTPQPAGDSGAAKAASDPNQTTLLGGEPAAKPGDAAKPADAPKSGDAKQGEAAKSDAGAKPEVKAPEKYADFKMPEGIEIDAKAVEAFTPVFREMNLTQDQAQKLIDTQAAALSAQSTAYLEQLKDEGFALSQAGQVLAVQRDAWTKALKADPELGGANFDQNAQVAQRAIARFGSPALKQLLNSTGLGNHPEFVRLCLKVGSTISEDSTVLDGTASKAALKTTADVFYGDAKAG